MEAGVKVVLTLIVVAIICLVAAFFTESYWYKQVEIKVIDNCQYLRTYNGRGWSITHKGDCTNEVHRTIKSN
jgi:hypothetical protein